MATLRELKGRIGSVASSEKITGAMKMISSAKRHKAEMALKQLRPFRDQIEAILGGLVNSDATFSSPLMESRPYEYVALVVWGSDDGLCGGYNANIFKELLVKINALRQTHGESLKITLIPVGSKIAKACLRLHISNVKVDAAPGVDSKSRGDKVRDFAAALKNRFLSGEFDHIELFYMAYKSVSRQNIEATVLLPVSYEAFSGNKGDADRPYIFEPSPEAIFRSILPMYLLAVVQDVFTENSASEQAARVMAMQSANDNAKKLHDQLQLEFNKLRQQAITTELLDILGGQVNN